MTWSELFFDLIFVTGVRALGDLLRAGLLAKEEPELEAEVERSIGLFEYAVVFHGLWALWWTQATYGTRWGANDPWNFLHFGAFMLGVVSYVVAISHLEEPWGLLV